MRNDRVELTRRVLGHCGELGFELAGVAGLEPSAHAEQYRSWIAAGRHGNMEYLARPDAVEARLDPRKRWQELRSAIVVGLGYDPEGASVAPNAATTLNEPAAADTPTTPRGREAQHAEDNSPDRGVIARYARGRDYHKVLKSKLLRLLERIEGDVGHALPAARAYVDTGPVLERDLARRAGLGWFGRSTMLVNPARGSFFFIGALLVELDLEASVPFERDHCGTCSACVDACPTGALLGRNAAGAPVMDATRCISYLTIENRGAIPRELRSAIGNRIYGCDICQEVCPFTRKFSTPSLEPDFAPRAGVVAPPLVQLMKMSAVEWDSFSQGSAVRRAKRSGFLRNVAVALGNWGDESAVPALVDALSDDEALIRGHAAWALGEIESSAATAALHAAVETETDPWVLEEIAAAIGALRS
jgi:epoxyqueuosine reductase